MNLILLHQRIGMMNALRLVRAATSSSSSSSLLMARALSVADGRGGVGRALTTHQFSSTAANSSAAPPMSSPTRPPAALRRLARDGADALRPKLVLSPYPEDPAAIMYRNERPTMVRGSSGAAGDDSGAEANDTATATASAIEPSLLSSYDVRRSWHKPKVSRRKAQVLRKAAIRNGTYGTFQSETGEGWDASWDAELFLRRRGGNGGGGVSSSASPNEEEKRQELGRYRVTVPKKPKRQRTREQRAQLIDRNMADMDARVEEYYAAKHASKPPNTFENLHKRLMRVKK